MTRRDVITKAVEDYYAGNSTIGETHWRLLSTVVEEPEQIDALLADMPPDIAESWLEWAQQYRGDGKFVWLSSTPKTAKDERALGALRQWLDRNPSSTD